MRQPEGTAMNEKLSKTLLLTLALGFGVGTTLPVRGETTKTGKDADAKITKSVVIGNDSHVQWTFGVMAKAKKDVEESDGNVEIWVVKPAKKEGAPTTIARLENWSGKGGTCKIQPGAEILVAPKPAGTLSRDAFRKTCYLQDGSGKKVQFIMIRDVGKDVEEKMPDLSYTTGTKALFGPSVKRPTPEDGNGIIHRWIGEAVDLQTGNRAPMVTIAQDSLP
jgi:hypothetical protein